AGYDQLKNYEAAHELNAQAIIPLNLRNEKEPPTGFSSNGTPRCSMGFDMVYWGADKRYLKFRCPHTVGKVDCPHGSAWCSPSDYGMVVKVNPNDDLRRFSIPHRDTKRWKELYNKRTSVERVFARLKENLTVNQLHIRGIQKVKTQVFLNLCILLASALAMSKASVRQRCA
ncbi:transposase, partial [Aneurinibacillus thermoaerophilus]